MCNAFLIRKRTNMSSRAAYAADSRRARAGTDTPSIPPQFPGPHLHLRPPVALMSRRQFCGGWARHRGHHRGAAKSPGRRARRTSPRRQLGSTAAAARSPRGQDEGARGRCAAAQSADNSNCRRLHNSFALLSLSCDGEGREKYKNWFAPAVGLEGCVGGFLRRQVRTGRAIDGRYGWSALCLDVECAVGSRRPAQQGRVMPRVASLGSSPRLVSGGGYGNLFGKTRAARESFLSSDEGAQTHSTNNT